MTTLYSLEVSITELCDADSWQPTPTYERAMYNDWLKVAYGHLSRPSMDSLNYSRCRIKYRDNESAGINLSRFNQANDVCWLQL